MKNGIMAAWISLALGSVILLLLASCEPLRLTIIPMVSPTSMPTGVPSMTLSPIPTVLLVTPFPTASIDPYLTPSPIPTYPLDQLKDKLPATPPAYGFMVLQIPDSVDWNGMITVTILTAPGGVCRILYWGTSGLSLLAELDPRIADANGICSWTWKQAQILGKAEGSLPLKARISIVAGDRWGDYYLMVK
jgi:hypothetical protein